MESRLGPRKGKCDYGTLSPKNDNLATVPTDSRVALLLSQSPVPCRNLLVCQIATDNTSQTARAAKRHSEGFQNGSNCHTPTAKQTSPRLPGPERKKPGTTCRGPEPNEFPTAPR